VGPHSFTHKGHQLLELTEFGHRMHGTDLGVLNTFEVFLEFPGEGGLQTHFELSQVFRVALQLLIVFAFQKATLLRNCQRAALGIDLRLEPLLSGVLDSHLKLA